MRGHLLIFTANVLFGISLPVFKYLLVGIDIDYETIGANGSMLMVATSGTAVVI